MKTNSKRRSILKGAMAAGVVSVAAGAGMLTPRMVLASWPQAAFEAKDINEALTKLVGGSSLSESGDITLKAPPIAEMAQW